MPKIVSSKEAAQTGDPTQRSTDICCNRCLLSQRHDRRALLHRFLLRYRSSTTECPTNHQLPATRTLRPRQRLTDDTGPEHSSVHATSTLNQQSRRVEKTILLRTFPESLEGVPQCGRHRRSRVVGRFETSLTLFLQDEQKQMVKETRHHTRDLQNQYRFLAISISASFCGTKKRPSTG